MTPYLEEKREKIRTLCRQIERASCVTEAEINTAYDAAIAETAVDCTGYASRITVVAAEKLEIHAVRRFFQKCLDARHYQDAAWIASRLFKRLDSVNRTVE